MSHRRTTRKMPDWDALYGIAETQSGHFTTAQAAAAGYSSQLLHKYVAQRPDRPRAARGLPRHAFPGRRSGRPRGAVALGGAGRGLLPPDRPGTPRSLRRPSGQGPHDCARGLAERRLRVPKGLVLHFADMVDRECEWLDAVPITSLGRTLLDCIDAHLAPDLLRQALKQARARGLVSRSESASVGKRLAAVLKGTR